MTEIRCPYCNKKILEHAEGVVVFTCPKCKQTTIIDTKKAVAVN
jgi:phage FluMu protein Com